MPRPNRDRVSTCPEHGTPMRTEPLTRFDGKQIGSLTIDVCDRCDDETDENMEAFCRRIADGDFDDA